MNPFEVLRSLILGGFAFAFLTVPLLGTIIVLRETVRAVRAHRRPALAPHHRLGGPHGLPGLHGA